MCYFHFPGTTTSNKLRLDGIHTIMIVLWIKPHKDMWNNELGIFSLASRTEVLWNFCWECSWSKLPAAVLSTSAMQKRSSLLLFTGAAQLQLMPPRLVA